jgi:hypothetical protein
MVPVNWRKFIGQVWVFGWLLHLIVAGFSAWPKMPFNDWIIYTGFQAAYGLLWPVWLVLGLLGYRP